jgi:hypothetical protein
MNAAYPQDLAMIAAIFGVATLVWAGWAQERPPSWPWRIVLGAMSLAGLALVGFSIPAVIGAWGSGTAIEPGSPAFIAYVVWFWLEVVVAAVGAIMLIRRRRKAFVAPFILVIVGLHFFPLAAVFEQPVLHGVAVLLTAIGVTGFLVRRRFEPSFWAGTLAAPVLAAVGLWALVTAYTVAG